MRTCCVCGEPDGCGGRELRPYGPGGRPICFECASSSPERRAETEANMAAAIEAAAAASPHGVAVVGPGLDPSPLVLPGDRP